MPDVSPWGPVSVTKDEADAVRAASPHKGTGGGHCEKKDGTKA
jgi:hypothetical protein